MLTAARCLWVLVTVLAFLPDRRLGARGHAGSLADLP